MAERLALSAHQLLEWKSMHVGMGCVEIVREGKLEKLYFPLPRICLTYWENTSIRESKRRMKYIFMRDNQIDRVELFHMYSSLLLQELQYSASVDSSWVRSKLASNEPIWMNVTFVLAVILNFIHIHDADLARGEISMSTQSLHVASVLLGWMHFVFAFFRLYAHVVSRRQLVLSEYTWLDLVDGKMDARGQRYRNPNLSKRPQEKVSLLQKAQTTRSMLLGLLRSTSSLCKSLAMSVGILTDSSFGLSRTVSFSNFQEQELETAEEENRGDMFQEHQKNSLLATESDMNSMVSNILVLASAKFNIAYLVLSAIGFIASFPEYQVRGLRLVCYALALLDICIRNRTLGNVLSDVQQNRNSLAQTFLLVVVVVFIYATIGYAAFHESYRLGGQPNSGCRSVFECMVTHFNQGLREDIASTMSVITWEEAPSHSIFRLVFDVSSWLLITVLLLNIVSGIIIDTFGELRDRRSSVDKDLESKCFICGIDRMHFQRHGSGFDHHVRHEHNMWQYVFLQQYLKDKDKSEYTGQESYVWKMLTKRDTSYYPVGKAMSLEKRTPSSASASASTLSQRQAAAGKRKQEKDTREMNEKLV